MENQQPVNQPTATPIHPVNQVTTVSKYLALALFIALPFLGGWVGYSFAPITTIEVAKTVTIEKEVPEETIEAAPLVVTNAQIIDDSVEVTYSDQKRKMIAKAIKASEVEDIQTIESYTKVLISPDGTYVALEGVGFEDSFVTVYNVAEDRLEAKHYGSPTAWTPEGKLRVNACDLSGEECVRYISVSPENPWILEPEVKS